MENVASQSSSSTKELRHAMSRDELAQALSILYQMSEHLEKVRDQFAQQVFQQT